MLHTNRQPRLRNLLWLPLSLALFFGAQLLEASHWHGETIGHAECIQCQGDGGQAVLENEHSHSAIPATSSPKLRLCAVTTRVLFQKQTARGPPAISA